MAAIGTPAAILPSTGISNARAEAPAAGRRRRRRGCVRQLDHLQRARPVGQAAQEAALFQRGDQAVDAGLGRQIQRLLHFVERGRNAGFLQPLMDEQQKLALLGRQHGPAASREHITNVLWVFRVNRK
jgi:hypothetical protein